APLFPFARGACRQAVGPRPGGGRVAGADLPAHHIAPGPEVPRLGAPSPRAPGGSPDRHASARGDGGALPRALGRILARILAHGRRLQRARGGTHGGAYDATTTHGGVHRPARTPAQ